MHSLFVTVGQDNGSFATEKIIRIFMYITSILITNIATLDLLELESDSCTITLHTAQSMHALLMSTAPEQRNTN